MEFGTSKTASVIQGKTPTKPFYQKGFFVIVGAPTTTHSYRFLKVPLRGLFCTWEVAYHFFIVWIQVRNQQNRKY